MKRWISVDGGVPTSCVAPNTKVRAEVIPVGGARAPSFIEVRRTYETAIGRFMRALRGSSSKKVIELAKVAEVDDRVEYEAWSAVQYEPFVRPTRLYFRGIDARRGDRTPPLSVTPTLVIGTNRPAARMKATDPTGTLPLGVEIPLWPERKMTVTVQAPVDPEIELFVITPTEGSESLSLGSYVDAYLGGIERELEDESESVLNPKGLRSAFEREYEAFIEGAGRIAAEIESPRRIVRPGEPQEFEVVLHPETSGEMMLAFGARDVESGEVLSVSELLPLRWEAGNEPTESSAGDQIVNAFEAVTYEVIRKKRQSARVTPAPEFETSA